MKMSAKNPHQPLTAPNQKQGVTVPKIVLWCIEVSCFHCCFVVKFPAFG